MLRTSASAVSLDADDVASTLQRIQSTSALRREQRREASVREAVAAAQQQIASRCTGAAAATAVASKLRAAAYQPAAVQSAVPGQHRTSSRLPMDRC